jgi:hypothetical protein
MLEVHEAVNPEYVTEPSVVNSTIAKPDGNVKLYGIESDPLCRMSACLYPLQLASLHAVTVT